MIFTKVVVFCIIILVKKNYNSKKNLLASLIYPLVKSIESTKYFRFMFLFTYIVDKMENRDVPQACASTITNMLWNYHINILLCLHRERIIKIAWVNKIN